MSAPKCDYCGGWNTVGCGTCQQRRMREQPAQHTPGPLAEKVTRINGAIDTLAGCAAVLPQAMAFTETVERFFRGGDGSDPRAPTTESEVAEAMYALRSAIAKATGSTS